MKRTLVLLLLVVNLVANAQEASVEKSIFGIQTGFAGLWVHNELKLANRLALRSEIGIENDFAVGEHYKDAGFILQPVLTIEPRFYYNLKRRHSNGKKTAKNGANYFSIKTSYHPDWFVINLDDDITKTADLSIVPTWGMRRQIGTHFTYETGLGLGFRMVYLKPNYYDGGSQNVDDESSVKNQYTPYLHIRLGYSF